MFDCDDSEEGFMGFRLGSGDNRNEGYGMPGFTEDGEVDMSDLSQEEQAEWNEIAGVCETEDDESVFGDEILPFSELNGEM